MNNGLMQTLAFYAYKDKDGQKAHHRVLNGHLLGWLHQRGLVADQTFSAAMKDLHGAASADYRRATQEALDLLKWIRQFAPAVTPAVRTRRDRGA
jgi:CRISPR-associated protein Cmr5